MNNKTRSSCRQAMKRGIHVVEVSDEEVKECWKMNYLTFKRQGQLPRFSLDLYLSLYEILSKNHHVCAYLAKYNDETVASISAILFKPTAYVWILGFNYKHRYFRPNHLLMWHLITELKKAGFESLDYGGNSIDRPTLGRYKSSWGTSAENTYLCERFF